MISLLLLQMSEQYRQITEQYNQLAQHVQVLTSENNELKQLTPNTTNLSNKQQQSLIVAQQQSLDIDTPDTSLSAAQIQPHLSGTVPDYISVYLLCFSKNIISMPNTASKFYYLTLTCSFSTKQTATD